MPTHWRSSFSAATQAVAQPQNGSKTVSPLGWKRQRSRAPTAQEAFESGNRFAPLMNPELVGCRTRACRSGGRGSHPSSASAAVLGLEQFGQHGLERTPAPCAHESKRQTRCYAEKFIGQIWPVFVWVDEVVEAVPSSAAFLDMTVALADVFRIVRNVLGVVGGPVAHCIAQQQVVICWHVPGRQAFRRPDDAK